MLYIQEHLAGYRRNPSGPPHLQTSSTQVRLYLSHYHDVTRITYSGLLMFSSSYCSWISRVNPQIKKKQQYINAD